MSIARSFAHSLRVSVLEELLWLPDRHAHLSDSGSMRRRLRFLRLAIEEWVSRRSAGSLENAIALIEECACGEWQSHPGVLC